MRGGELIYREEGGKFRVRVINDQLLRGKRFVELECLETIRPSPRCGSIPAGTKFTATCERGHEYLVGWTLSES